MLPDDCQEPVRRAKAGDPLELNMPEFTNRMVAAHKARKTSAQQGIWSGCCNTDENGNHCIIGSGLPEGFIRHEEFAFNGIQSLITEGVIKIPEKYVERLTEIQLAHDRAINNEYRAERGKNLKQLRDRLRKFAMTIKRDYPEAYAV